jgi:hypothetical protein
MVSGEWRAMGRVGIFPRYANRKFGVSSVDSILYDVMVFTMGKGEKKWMMERVNYLHALF